MRKFILSALLVMVLAIAAFLLADPQQPLFAFHGSQPTNLGTQAPCPPTPNCVSSQANGDQQHYIEPIAYQSPDTYAQITKILTAQKHLKIIKATDNYIYAQATSRLMGFVDDLEFYFQPMEQIIHLRSASRLGESDLGVNRQRLEQIKLQLNKAYAG